MNAVWLLHGPLQHLVRRPTLEIFGPESGVFGDASKHLGANLFSVMKCEDEIGPTLTVERAM